jgi:hypothetical protein
VVARVGCVEVADGEGGVQRLLHVAVLETVLVVGALGPRAGVAVGLELERHRRELLAVLSKRPSSSWTSWPYSCATMYATEKSPIVRP